jgi:hypothetical protein
MVKARLSMKQRPALSQTNLARLEAIFDEDLELMSRWLGVDLSCRSFDEKTAMTQLDWLA